MSKNTVYDQITIAVDAEDLINEFGFVEAQKRIYGKIQANLSTIYSVLSENITVAGGIPVAVRYVDIDIPGWGR